MSAINPEVDSVGIILAAGHGRRMRSRIPKPLPPRRRQGTHQISGGVADGVRC